MSNKPLYELATLKLLWDLNIMQDSQPTAVFGSEMGKRGLDSDFILKQKIKLMAQENLLLE